MADKKISQLNDGTSFQAGDEAVVNRSGTNYKVDPTKLATAELVALAESKAVTAVDVFVYDTSRDSDGGAWRKRTQHTSWYNETLNTATRGSRREFPAVAVIVAESTKVTIYDGDDPSLPMWMVFNSGADASNETLLRYAAVEKVSALNAKMAVVTELNRGLVVIDFIEESNSIYRTNGLSSFVENASTLANRNDTYLEPTVLDASIETVNDYNNDVAMTVLPDAPIDQATGLPIPTIAVATDGGVSVIKDDGTVVDLTSGQTSSKKVTNVFFDDTNRIWIDAGYEGNDLYSAQVYSEIPETDFVYGRIDIVSNVVNIFNSYTPVNPSGKSRTGSDQIVSDFVQTKDNYAFGFPSKLSLLDSTANSQTGMVAYVASSYNTGWMPGDIKGAFLSDTDDTDLVGSGELVTNGTFDTDTDWTKGTGWTISGGELVATLVAGDSSTYQNFTTVAGQTYTATVDCSAITAGAFRFYYRIDGGAFQNYVNIVAGETTSLTFTASTTSSRIVVYAFGTSSGVFDNISVKLADVDRSVNNNGLIINGTVTRSAVATGADLVAYSGFSTSNYLEQPYNADLDFGTGDFCVMGWMKGGSSAQVLLDRRNPSVLSQAGFFLYVDSSPIGTLRFATQDGTATSLINSTALVTGASWKHVCAVRSSSGTLLQIYINGVLDKSATVTARNVSNASATTTLGLESEKDQYPFDDGSLALWRISATAPTAEQIKKIYEDEKVLFQEGAQATLYGASDAVTALAHDPVTDLLHVGTSAGRSVFQGLRRVDNTTDAVGTAISAVDSLVVEE